MDRFKFRGRRTEDGTLVYGSLLRNECGWHIATFESYCIESDTDSWELKMVLVGIIDGSQEQCAGLKDKNGKLIYEGDICSFTVGRTPEADVVKYSDIYAHYWCGNANMGATAMEIIGNIHNDSHLLENPEV